MEWVIGWQGCMWILHANAYKQRVVKVRHFYSYTWSNGAFHITEPSTSLRKWKLARIRKTSEEEMWQSNSVSWFMPHMPVSPVQSIQLMRKYGLNLSYIPSTKQGDSSLCPLKALWPEGGWCVDSWPSYSSRSLPCDLLQWSSVEKTLLAWERKGRRGEGEGSGRSDKIRVGQG